MQRMIVFVAAVAVAAVVGTLVAGGPAGAVGKADAVTELNNPAFDPFQAEVFPKASQCQFLDVPSGKRLVIEYVSARVETAQSREMVITTTGGGAVVDHYVPLSEEFVTISIASQPVR